MAVLMNQATANTKASSTAAPRCCSGDKAACCSGWPVAPFGAGAARSAAGNIALSGKPMTKCRPAHTRQAPRHPMVASSQAVNGHPTVLAKPANNVMPVMVRRACRPCSRTAVANAASYRPLPIARPITAQAAKTCSGCCAWLSAVRPAANTTLLAISAGRPPRRSISLPANGPMAADMSRATEKAPNTAELEVPTSRAMAPVRMAGR